MNCDEIATRDQSVYGLQDCVDALNDMNKIVPSATLKVIIRNIEGVIRALIRI